MRNAYLKPLKRQYMGPLSIVLNLYFGLVRLSKEVSAIEIA